MVFMFVSSICNHQGTQTTSGDFREDWSGPICVNLVSYHRLIAFDLHVKPAN